MKNNKFFKKFAATFLAAAILLASAPLSGFAGLDFLDLFNISASAYFRASGACGDAVSWEVNFETDVMIVSGNGTMLNYSDTSRSPWYDYSGDIEIVTIEEGVTNIGNYAFNNCSYLRKITIPESVTSIGDYAFAGCDDLTDVYFPGTQEQWNSIQINSNNDLLLNATIHYNEVNTVFDGTFAGLDWSANTSTGELIINGNGTIIEGVSSFRAPWFTYSSYIKKLTIGEGIDEIESNAFRMLSNLTSVTLPKSLCAIRSSAFSYCKSLTDINFPENLQSIGGYAFENCRNLTIVKIPKSVTSIGSYAFNNCDSLKDVFYVGTEEEWKKITIGSCNNDLIYANIYYNEDENEKVLTGTCGENLTWTLDKSTGELKVEGTGYMYGYSYMGGSSHSSRPWEKYKNLITTITICEGVTNIGSHAFSYCTRLTSITIPDSVTSIGTSAFLDCSSLTSITIPDSVTSIGYWAFLACESLTSITIPDSVTSISSTAFNRCTNLTGITVSEGNTTYWSNEYGILFNKNKTELIRYPEGIKQKSYTIPDSVTCIGDDAFNRCTSLTSITIPDSVTSIGDDAFYNCENLTSITIPDSVTSIGDGAFCDCTSLTSITIPDGVTSISDDAFYWCESLTSITIPDSITSIGSRAFGYCKSLTSVTIPCSVTSIGKDAFTWCNEITDVCYSGSVTDWCAINFQNEDSNPASYCENLYFNGTLVEGDLVIPYGVTIIGNSFSNYDNLTSITIPDSVTSIGDYAFYWCESLTSITIPNSVKSIGNYAFSYCNSLRDVYFGGTEEEWNNIAISPNNYELLNATIHFAGSEHEHSYTSEITTQPTCTAEGVETFVCECGDSYTKAVPANGHTLSHITVESTCKVAGMEYDLCSECEEIFNSGTLPLAEHTWGEWTVTAEPTTENEGTKTRTCSVCSEEETESIPKLEVIVNEETGIEIVFGGEFGDGVEVQASEVYDGKSFQLVEANYGNVKTTIFDISTTVDGVAVQPEGKVKVRIPLPEGFGAGKVVVCYVDSENGKVTSIPAKVVDGYVEFETDHFSHYALLATKGKVHSVKIDDIRINYKDTMIIRPEIYADDGVRYTVTYSTSNPSVAQVNQNGKITATAFGGTTITCTVTDEYGNTVTEKFTVNVRYTFWQWIIMLFLFGELWY